MYFCDKLLAMALHKWQNYFTSILRILVTVFLSLQASTDTYIPTVDDSIPNVIHLLLPLLFFMSGY